MGFIGFAKSIGSIGFRESRTEPPERWTASIEVNLRGGSGVVSVGAPGRRMIT